MTSYLLRRGLIGLFTLLAITFLCYALIRSMPGDPTLVLLQSADPNKPPRKEDLERFRKDFNLDKPWIVGYGLWLGGVVRGDFGVSYAGKGRVGPAVYQRIGPTLSLSIASLVLTYLLAIPMGMYATVRSNRLDERIVSTLLYMLYSLPSYVAALFLQILFAVRLQGTPFELPLFGRTSPGFDQLSTLGQAADLFAHAVLPVACFTYGSLAYFSRFIRANMLETIRQDYVRTARAKGVPGWRILWRHAFANTLIPLVTMVGLTLPGLLSGAIILERIFSWPGMGSLFLEAILTRDYPIIMAIILLLSILTLLGQLLADVLYAFVDPRITYS